MHRNIRQRQARNDIELEHPVRSARSADVRPANSALCRRDLLEADHDLS